MATMWRSRPTRCAETATIARAAPRVDDHLAGAQELVALVDIGELEAERMSSPRASTDGHRGR